MTIIFQHDNGTSRAILQPETPRDVTNIGMCRELRQVRIDAGKPDVLVIVFENGKEKDGLNGTE